MRLLQARCSVLYDGRLVAELESAVRLIMLKADGSVLVHSDTGGYRPLMWMTPPCSYPEPVPGVWVVCHDKTGETLTVTIEQVLSDTRLEFGPEPGLVRQGVEAELQVLLSDRLHVLGADWTLVRREYETGIGPVDILCRDESGQVVAVEIKRRGGIDGVEQLTRYLTRLNNNADLGAVRGVFAAQEITPQARTLAADRGITCVTLDYDGLRGMEGNIPTLF